MLHLIAEFLAHMLPAPLHRLALKVAHKTRHQWRKIAKPHLLGVCVILCDDNARVLLVRHTYGPDYWSLPGGGMNRGEESEAAARREMREELSVELAGLKSLGTLDESLSGTRHTAHLFTAQAKGEITPDGREVAEARYFAPEALPDKTGAIARGRISFFREL